MYFNLPNIYLMSRPDDATMGENTAYTEDVIRRCYCPLNATLRTSFDGGVHKLSFDMQWDAPSGL